MRIYLLSTLPVDERMYQMTQRNMTLVVSETVWRFEEEEDLPNGAFPGDLKY